eukprot:jgi/Chrzof1/2747/Cz11g27210.t1
MVQGRRASLELAAKAYLGGALTADADFGIHAHQHMGRHQAALHHADGSQGPAIHPQSSSDHLQQQLQLHAATMARAAVASQPGRPGPTVTPAPATAAAAGHDTCPRQLKTYTGKKPVLSTVVKNGVVVYERVSSSGSSTSPLPRNSSSA